jgi:uncharacterized RDD family membrane protein YckC
MDSNPYAAPNAPLDPVVNPGGGPLRVGFGPRFGAALIDLVVVAALGVVIGGAVASMFPDYLAEVIARQTAKTDPKVAEQMKAMGGFFQAIARFSAGAAVAGALYGLIEAFSGRSLGKLLLGLRIADTNGKVATLGRLMGRWAVKQSGSLMALLAMVTGVYLIAQIAQVPSWAVSIGFLLVLGKKRMALHDMAAQTAVYRNSDVILER